MQLNITNGYFSHCIDNVRNTLHPLVIKQPSIGYQRWRLVLWSSIHTTIFQCRLGKATLYWLSHKRYTIYVIWNQCFSSKCNTNRPKKIYCMSQKRVPAENVYFTKVIQIEKMSFIGRPCDYDADINYGVYIVIMLPITFIMLASCLNDTCRTLQSLIISSHVAKWYGRYIDTVIAFVLSKKYLIYFDRGICPLRQNRKDILS